MGAEPSQSVFEAAHGTVLFLVLHQGGVGQPRGVIEGDVEELPAGAALAALACAVAGDAMADAVDAAELVGVEVDQCAGPFALVADDLARRDGARFRLR
jgi:hypothetical protein